MSIFRMELYRIFSRKITWIALLAALSFSMFYGLTPFWREGTIDGGSAYMREEAVARDREIAAEFTGPLTEETVRAIWEKYGAPVNFEEPRVTWDALTALAAQGGNDNYCNRFVAGWFGEKAGGAEGSSAAGSAEGSAAGDVAVSAAYVLPERLPHEQYLSGEYYFGYLGNGWENFRGGLYEIVYILICLVTVITLSPMFSEDYAFRTADTILPTARGRGGLWGIRTAAGCFVASLFYWLACGSLFLQQLGLYGAEGLKVSCAFAAMSGFWPKNAMSVGEAIRYLYLAGWFSILVLVLLVQAVSAGSRQSFSSLIKSIALYFGPYVFMRAILNLFPAGRINMLLHYICYSMPFSYPFMILEAPSGSGLEELLTLSALTAAVLGGALGMRLYCRHEVKS